MVIDDLDVFFPTVFTEKSLLNWFERNKSDLFFLYHVYYSSSSSITDSFDDLDGYC